MRGEDKYVPNFSRKTWREKEQFFDVHEKIILKNILNKCGKDVKGLEPAQSMLQWRAFNENHVKGFTPMPYFSIFFNIVQFRVAFNLPQTVLLKARTEGVAGGPNIG